MRLATLILLLPLFLPAASPAQEDRTPLSLPRQWVTSDVKAASERYAVVVEEFPSTLLAEAVASSLRELGWSPVFVQRHEDSARVLVGNLGSSAGAVWLVEELRLQKVAEAAVATLGRERPEEEGVEGPFLQPFADRHKDGSKALRLNEVLPALESRIDGLVDPRRSEMREHLGNLTSGAEESQKGPAAAAITRLLLSERAEPDIALFLAIKVAAGDWPAATEEDRLFCAGLAADLLMEHRRDWHAAWASTQALLGDSDRSREGRSRDLLRRAALEIELAATGESPKPTWANIRQTLRESWDNASKRDYRSVAGIELVYLKTFAWAGDWDSVELLAKDFLRRHSRHAPAETASARIWLARSLERREAWDVALLELDRALNSSVLREEQIYNGFEPWNIRAEALRWRAHFTELAIEEEVAETGQADE